jgi:hypothetical protein
MRDVFLILILLYMARKTATTLIILLKTVENLCQNCENTLYIFNFYSINFNKENSQNLHYIRSKF